MNPETRIKVRIWILQRQESIFWWIFLAAVIVFAVHLVGAYVWVVLEALGIGD